MQLPRAFQSPFSFHLHGVRLCSKKTKQKNIKTNMPKKQQKKTGEAWEQDYTYTTTYIDSLLKRNGSSPSSLCQCHYCTCIHYHFSNHSKVDACLVIFISQFYTHGQVVDYILGILTVYFNLNHECIKAKKLSNTTTYLKKCKPLPHQYFECP